MEQEEALEIIFCELLKISNGTLLRRDSSAKKIWVRLDNVEKVPNLLDVHGCYISQRSRWYYKPYFKENVVHVFVGNTLSICKYHLRAKINKEKEVIHAVLI